MVRGYSKAIIIGNLTRDPESRTTPNGANVTSFAVAVNRTYRNASGENVEEVSYFDCAAWGRQGETIAQYAHRGDAMLVSGRIRQDRYQDKDGNNRSRVEITVEDFQFLGSARQNDGGNFNGNSSQPAGAPASADVIPTDIPDGAVDLQDIPF